MTPAESAAKLADVKARWAAHGGELASAERGDKCVIVPARPRDQTLLVEALVRAAPADVAFLAGEVERLRGALAWYAGADYSYGAGSGGEPIGSEADADSGERAREALGVAS